MSLLNPQTFLTRKDAATLLREAGLRVGLRALESRDGGPPYRIIYGRAFYLRDELEQWLERQVRGSGPTQAA